MAHQELKKVQKKIRRDLEREGTNVAFNDSDLYGDGDQSTMTGRTSAQQQFYRDLFSSGGDINYLADVGLTPLSEFARDCIIGHVPKVRAAIEKADTDPTKPSQELIQLLEKRETTQRLSPLMMIISIGKNVSSGGSAISLMQLETVQALLEYGARPDARDVCGKTVCHYGMGSMATDMSIQAAEYCIQAHESSQFFGKEVELHSLKTASTNGLRGICKGFVVSTGRRAIYLFDRQQTVGIKPENLKLADGSASEERPKLCDIQDRIGGLALHEVIMKERVDVAKVLLEKYGARFDLADGDGCSPKSMAVTAGPFSRVGAMIMKQAMRQGRADKKEKTNACSCCGKADVDLQACSVCHSVQYCSRECQTTHWKKGGHKQECKRLTSEKDDTVVLEKPAPGGMTFAITNVSGTSNASGTAAGTFRKPSGVKVDEQFYIKIQGGGPMMPLMIYDKTREFLAHVEPGHPAFEKLRAKVAADPNANGRKTYLKCSFDVNGKCTVYLGTRSVKTW